MKPKKAHIVRSSLLKKGFLEVNRDHGFFILHVDGKKTGIHTKISHGENEIATSLLSMMARQLKLSGLEFEALINCPLSAEEYHQKLEEQKHL